VTETLVLPLYPLEGRVLFPGQDLRVHLSAETDAAALARSGGPGGTLIATVREIEQRERFLRPWTHLRGGSAWN
jgi:hypothetical protein